LKLYNLFELLNSSRCIYIFENLYNIATFKSPERPKKEKNLKEERNFKNYDGNKIFNNNEIFNDG